MKDQATFENPTIDELRAVYERTDTIAVVGASSDPNKAAHTVPEYLQSVGYRIVPVSPRGGELFGEKVYSSLSEVDVPIDVVQVFRPSEEVPPIARDAVALEAKALWMQPGIVSTDAAEIAQSAGLTVAMDICMRATHLLLGIAPRKA